MTLPNKPERPVRPAGGLTGALVGMLRLSSRKSPLTRATATARLVKRFPAFDPADVEGFVAANLPYRLRRFRGMTVLNDGLSPRGYWIPKKPGPKPAGED